MLVISDTSPLNYLILTDSAHVLHVMYGRVIVPQAVAEELSAQGTPPKARLWFAARPDWVEVHSVTLPTSHPELDAGEAEAIALAKALHADLLLIDERRATTVARNENLATTGTLGVLLDAALLNLLDLPSVLTCLERDTTFRAPPTLFLEVLHTYQTRRAQLPP